MVAQDYCMEGEHLSRHSAVRTHSTNHCINFMRTTTYTHSLYGLHGKCVQDKRCMQFEHVIGALRRHYDVMCLLGIWPPLAPQYSYPCPPPPPNIVNIPTPIAQPSELPGFLLWRIGDVKSLVSSCDEIPNPDFHRQLDF